MGFPCGLAGKESACNVRNLGSIPGSGRSPGEGKGYPLQYFGLENPIYNPIQWNICPFLIRLFPCYSWLFSILYILDITPLSDMWCSNTFSQCITYNFILLILSIRTKVLNIDVTIFSFLSSMDYAVGFKFNTFA